MIYTRAGGSYVVARENFGPQDRPDRLGGTADRLHRDGGGAGGGRHRGDHLAGARSEHWNLRDHDRVVLVLAYGNLRGVREAGKAFAFPTYFFFLSRWSSSSASSARSSAICRSTRPPAREFP